MFQLNGIRDVVYASKVLSIAEGLSYLSFGVKAQLVSKNIETHDYIGRG